MAETPISDMPPESASSAHPPTDHKLGLAGGMAKLFIHSPLSPLLYLAMLVLGIVGMIITPRQEDPQISVPMIDVFVSYPGASAEEVANLALDPLQRVMSEIPGVKHVYAVAQREGGMITVRFTVGEEIGPSVVKVHDKISSNLDKMPPGVMQPLVKPKGIDDVPVVTLTLWSDVVDDAQLRQLGLRVLQEAKQVIDTGEGFVVGGRAEQIRVEVKPERLSGYGIGVGQIAQTIQGANRGQGTGSVVTGGDYFKVYTGSFLKDTDDVANLAVGTHNGSPVYIRDIAEVTRQPEELKQMVTYFTGPKYAGDVQADGEAAVTVAVAKKVGSNGVDVANGIIAKVESLKGTLIPDNVHVEVTRNYGKTADDKVNELIFKLFVATGAVTVLVLIALGMRPAIVVTLVIPVVLLMTVFGAWVMEYSINRVSLFALIFSIGILVDDAIVVVENIYRRWLMAESMDTATAIDAVREVGNPTILATFTVVAALLPMSAVRGLMGPYMAPIPALGTVAMLFSLFAAFAFVPWFIMRMRPSMAGLKRAAKKEHAQEQKLDGLFRRLLNPLLDNRFFGFLFLGGLVFTFFAVCAMFYFTAVPVKMLPFDNKPEFGVVIDMPEGTALGPTQNIAWQVAAVMRGIPEVTAIQTYAGTAKPFDFNGMVRHYYLRKQPWQGEVQVQLLDKHLRKRTSHQIATEARALIQDIAAKSGAELTVVEMPPGPPVIQTIAAEIYAPSIERLNQATEELTEIFRQVDGEHTEARIADTRNFLEAPHQVVTFEVNTEKAARRGISVNDVVSTLEMAMGGYKVGDIKHGAGLEPTYIEIEIPLEVRAQTSRLGDLPVAGPSGTTVPLAEVGSFSKGPQDQLLFFKDLRPMQYVVGDAVGRLGAPTYPMFVVDDLLAERNKTSAMPIESRWFGVPTDQSQVEFEWAGEWTVTFETFRDMGIAFAMALVLIYMLLVAQFGNFLIPAITLAPIPLTLLGIVPGHWLVGMINQGSSAEFTATSMIGFIALAGIIVRNSILLVDFALHTIAEDGVLVREAMILSCKARTRPIIITALALIAGSSVILTDPIFQGMAISLLFGSLVSTLLTLVVIPLGCISASKAMQLSAGVGVAAEA